MRILHLEAYNYSDIALEKLRLISDLDIQIPASKEELNNLLKVNSYDAIFTTIGNTLDKQNLSTQKELKYIISPTTGLNHIDLLYAKENNIEIISLKGEYEFLSTIQSTAEHTWMLILAIVRKFKKTQENIANGIWDRKSLLCDELNTRTIGIIGYGRLGKIVAQYAKAFSMEVLIHEREEKNQSIAIANGLKCCELEELLSQSDVVVLLVDYSKENEKMMGHKQFESMKNKSFFVNTSRGELVDEEALLIALENKIIEGAALDVLIGDSDWKTTIPINNKLFNYAQNNTNLILTPHIGGYGNVSIQRTRDFIIEKFLNEITK